MDGVLTCLFLKLVSFNPNNGRHQSPRRHELPKLETAPQTDVEIRPHLERNTFSNVERRWWRGNRSKQLASLRRYRSVDFRAIHGFVVLLRPRQTEGEGAAFDR